jgi:hypothetical protein
VKDLGSSSVSEVCSDLLAVPSLLLTPQYETSRDGPEERVKWRRLETKFSLDDMASASKWIKSWATTDNQSSGAKTTSSEGARIISKSEGGSKEGIGAKGPLS